MTLPLHLQELNNIETIPVLKQKALHYVLEQGIVQENDNDGDLWIEFGTFDGRSINPIAEYTDKIVYGFDSFIGLPEDWVCRGIPARVFDLGADDENFRFHGVKFDLEKLRVVPNVSFIPGWFDDTLPKFIKEHNNPISFIHLDSDIYSSAVCVFENTVKNIKPNCIIVFDELLSYNGFQDHEWKAWWEFVEKYDIEFEWIGGNIGGVIDLPTKTIYKKFGLNTPLSPQQRAEDTYSVEPICWTENVSPSHENCALRILKNPHYIF
tara:strand:+ start:28 stop:825 length:798 start_codon:yes stop_codon:yes gene_type:complete